MDDEDMGRPPRHERTAKRGGLSSLEGMLRRGSEDVVRVRGDRVCGCGTKLRVDFSGAGDSMGVRIARSRLEDALCDGCIEREDAERDAAERAAKRVEELRRRVEVCGVPPAARLRTLDELSSKPGQEMAMELARQWACGELRGLLMHGETGRGKTLIAAAATVSRCAFGPSRWLGMAGLLTDLRMPFESPEYARAVRQLDPGIRGCALALDDVDKMKPTEHSLQPLYVAVNRWIESGQPLLVTLNRDLDEFAGWAGATFGPMLASRLAGYCEVVHVAGEDWRLS